MATLRERIAALEKRNAASSPSVPASSSPSTTPSNGSAGRLKSVKDVASRFDEIGGAPIPRGSFGLGAPASAGPKATKSRELYGNRIPKPRNVSASGSPSRSPDGQRRTASGPLGGGGDSQAGSEMGDEDWEERASERSASPNGDHIDHQQHSSRSRSNSPSPNPPDVHDGDEDTHPSSAIEPPIIAVSTEEGLHVSSDDPAAVPAAAVHQPLPPSPEVELATPDEPVVAEPSPASSKPSPITQEPITEEAKPTEEVETQPAVEDTPRAATFGITESATEAEATAADVPADIKPAYVEPQPEKPAVVEAPAPAEDAPIVPATPIVQNGAPIHPAAVEEPVVSPAPEPAADQEPTPSPIVDAAEQAKPVVASPIEEPAAPRDPSPVAEQPIASEPVYEAASHGSLAAVPENEVAPQPTVGRPRGLSVHVPAAKPNNTTIIDEGNQTEIRALPPLPQMPAVRTNRSPASNIRATSMYLPASPVSPTMTEFAMGAGGVNPPARNSSLRRNVESTQARIERRIAVSTAGSGAGGTGFGRSGSSGWRPLPNAPDAPLPVVSVLPSRMKDRRDSQERSRPKSMAEIFGHGEWAAMPDLTLEIPKTPTRLPPSKLLPNPVPDSQRPLSSSTLASFMDSKQGTVTSTIFDEFPDVPNHIPESQLFSPTTEESSNLADSVASVASVPQSQATKLSPPHLEEDRTSAASVKSKGSKFRGLSKLMGSAAHSLTHGVQRTVSQRRRTSDASQSGSSPGHTYSDKKKHSTVIEPESPLRSTWMEEEKKKSGWGSIGLGRRK